MSRDLFSSRGKRKIVVFEVFSVYLRKFSIFFYEIFMVARSHRVLAADIKSLLISALVSLETRSRFWQFFDDFLHFLSCPFWYNPLT